MFPRVRRLVFALLVMGVPLLAATPAGAQLQGSCTIQFNGVGIDRIDTLDSPLELETTDTLVFGGTSDAGTLSATVRLLIGPVTIESGSSTYATPESEFQATISLDDVSPYGVGLYRVIGEADGCVGQAWVRISGRLPLATLTGLTALGLALGGVTGQLGAIVSRNRWSRSAAAAGGIATGAGIAVLAQQFGRLQISYPSVGAIIGIAAILGFGAAWFLNPALRETRVDRRRVAPAPAVPSPTTPRPERRTSAPPPERVAEPTRIDTPDGEVEAEAKEPAPPKTPEGPYWCYVMAQTDVFDLTDHTRRVATLVPGTWYLAKRTVGGWVHVVTSDGEEGWVAESGIHRQG